MSARPPKTKWCCSAKPSIGSASGNPRRFQVRSSISAAARTSEHIHAKQQKRARPRVFEGDLKCDRELERKGRGWRAEMGPRRISPRRRSPPRPLAHEVRAKNGDHRGNKGAGWPGVLTHPGPSSGGHPRYRRGDALDAVGASPHRARSSPWITHWSFFFSFFFSLFSPFFSPFLPMPSFC